MNPFSGNRAGVGLCAKRTSATQSTTIDAVNRLSPPAHRLQGSLPGVGQPLALRKPCPTINYPQTTPLAAHKNITCISKVSMRETTLFITLTLGVGTVDLSVHRRGVHSYIICEGVFICEKNKFAPHFNIRRCEEFHRKPF